VPGSARRCSGVWIESPSLVGDAAGLLPQRERRAGRRSFVRKRGAVQIVPRELAAFPFGITSAQSDQSSRRRRLRRRSAGNSESRPAFNFTNRTKTECSETRWRPTGPACSRLPAATAESVKSTRTPSGIREVTTPLVSVLPRYATSERAACQETEATRAINVPANSETNRVLPSVSSRKERAWVAEAHTRRRTSCRRRSQTTSVDDGAVLTAPR
jgi:hypothetical protein